MSSITAASRALSLYLPESGSQTSGTSQSKDSVRGGTVAARIRALQGQDSRTATLPQPTPSKKTPRRLDPDMLKFLENPQPPNSQSAAREVDSAPGSVSNPRTWLIHWNNADREQQHGSRDPTELVRSKSSGGTMNYRQEGPSRSLDQFEILNPPGSQHAPDALSGWRQPSPARQEAGETPPKRSYRPKLIQETSRGSPVTATSLTVGYGAQRSPNQPVTAAESLGNINEDVLCEDHAAASRVAEVPAQRARARSSESDIVCSDHTTAKTDSPGEEGSRDGELRRRLPWVNSAPRLEAREETQTRSKSGQRSIDNLKSVYEPPGIESPRPWSCTKARFLHGQPASQDTHPSREDPGSDDVYTGFTANEFASRKTWLETVEEETKSMARNYHRTRSYRARVGSNAFTELPNDRFDVFVRERAAEPGRRDSHPLKFNETKAPAISGTDHSTSSTTDPESALQAEYTRSIWRWWKLVYKEPARSTSQPSGLRERVPSKAGDGQHKGSERQGQEHDSSSSNELHQSHRIGSSGSFSESPLSIPSRRASFQPADLRGIPDTIRHELPTRNADSLRVQDAFGHGVLVDDQELSTEALEKLSSLERGSNATFGTTRVSRSRRRTEIGRYAKESRVHVPIEAIAPITQNDGTSSNYSVDGGTRRSRAKIFALPRQVIAEEASDVPIELWRETGSDGCKIAVHSEERRTIVNLGGEQDARGTKIVVTIEDGIKAVLKVEIYPGKEGTAVVQSVD